jgi:glyoxylase-like metal-dependent hydrolase (beta-lactamase superfamily II)
MDVGTIRIESILDGVLASPAAEMLVRPGVDDPWGPHQGLIGVDGMLHLPVGGFLVRTADRLVLVDAGLGPFDRDDMRSGALLDSLRATGVSPSEITDVVLTHLHFDHVGWVSQKGAVVFDNAVYRCHSADWEHFVTDHDALEGARRKLGPIESRLEMFSGDTTIAPGVDLRDAPGHTPGSAIVVVSSGAERALLLGDVVHCPFELTEPGWESLFDVDAALAKRTREALARELENTDVQMAGAHFEQMRFGRLLSGAGQRQWQVVG